MVKTDRRADKKENSIKTNVEETSREVLATCTEKKNAGETSLVLGDQGAEERADQEEET